MPDLALVPSRPDPPPARPPGPRTIGQGRASIMGADWSLWPAIDVEALWRRVREIVAEREGQGDGR